MPFLGFPRMPARTLALTLSLLLLGACSPQVPVQHSNVPITDPNDIESPAPTPAPTATPVPPSVIVSPSPAATPGWSSVTLTASADTYADLLAEVRSFEASGDVSNVVLLGNGRISLSGSAMTTAQLQETASAQSVAFRTLVQTSLFVADNTSRSLSNGIEFSNFWRSYITQLDGVPTIDFGSQTVLAVFAGPQGSSGYTTTVLSVRRSGNRLKVRYRVDPPAIASAPSNANPVHVVLVSASLARGDFEVIDYERVF